MEDNEIIPYSSQFSQDQMMSYIPIRNFIQKFKGYNFMRIEKKKISDVFDRFDIMVLRSAKRDQIYVLYRGMSEDETLDSMYRDEYPSSWTTDINTAFRFSHPIRGKTCIMKGVFRAAEIFIDIFYCVNNSDYEWEVLLMPGTYDIGYLTKDSISSQIDPFYPSSGIIPKVVSVTSTPVLKAEVTPTIEEDIPVDDMTLEELFHPKNLDELLSEDETTKLFFTYEDMLDLATQLELKVGKNPTKHKLIMLLIHHFNIK